MSKKVFNVFSILCFALVLCFIGCTELINPKTETDINLNIDLSKIIKSTRNTGETQSSASIDENPTIKVAIYDAKKYNATTNSTDKLALITEAQAKIVNNEAKVKLNNIPVGIDAIVFAELSFSNGNSTEVMYAGNSEVFRVKPTDNKISLVLIKVEVDIEVDIEVKPDDSNTPYEISSWGDLVDLVTKINSLSDVTTTTEFIIMNDLIATCTITVSKPVKITSDKKLIITRGSEFSGEFFYIDTGSLELGSNENNIILDGGNLKDINAAYPLILSSGNDLTLTNCTLQNNTLNNTNASFGIGGAVYVSSGTFTMNNSSIINCSANENGGAVYVSGGTFTMNGGGTISNCKANYGGAVYITDGGTFNMNGGSIYMCSASNSGGGVCMNSGSSFTMSGGKIDMCSEGGGVYVRDGSSFTMNGGAYVDSSNDVYLESGTTVTVAGELTAEKVTRITPFDYTVGTQVLTAESGINLEDYVDKFTLSNEEYCIDYYGKIALVSQNYAAGLTCVVDSDDNTVTLYIINAKGLAIFRNIVNGSFTEKIIVQDKSNPNSTHEFNADNEYQNVNAVLESDITLSGDWTPIGVYPTNTTTTAKPYSGTFDGNGKTIKFEITHNNPNMYSSGLFQMLAGTVKNLIIAGYIFRVEVGYIGSITGYLDGGTIENCVNEALITNSATNGTGGIVGYVGTAGGKITGCINLMKVSSSYSTVGGIVGNVGNMPVNSNLTISKCINLGEISGESNISGILGNANTSAISISDCMNLGKISTNKTSETAYASGITTPSENYTVSSCINVGEVTATATNSFQGGISSVTTKGIYTNNYYDSTVNSSVVDGSNTNGITGISTNNLIGSNISLNGISTDDWSFAEGRYLLPDIAGSIPGGENGEMWNAVIAAATPESPSISGGGNL